MILSSKRVALSELVVAFLEEAKEPLPGAKSCLVLFFPWAFFLSMGPKTLSLKCVVLNKEAEVLGGGGTLGHHPAVSLWFMALFFMKVSCLRGWTGNCCSLAPL